MTRNDAFKARRIELGLKPAELAVMGGCSVPTIYAIEAGRARVTLELSRRLARAMGCTLDEVFPPVADELVGRERVA